VWAASDVPKIQGDLTIFTAASLTDAFKEMAANIEKASPGSKVIFNFAGSPTLRTQLAQGARADAFASADEPNMQKAQQDGTIANEPRIFVHNLLIVIPPAQNPAGITGLQDLANLVSEENNVKQVVTKVQLGEADAGTVYSSDVILAVRDAVKVIEIPDQFNVTASYPIAVVKGARNEAGSRAFIEYVLSVTCWPGHPDAAWVHCGWWFLGCRVAWLAPVMPTFVMKPSGLCGEARWEMSPCHSRCLVRNP